MKKVLSFAILFLAMITSTAQEYKVSNFKAIQDGDSIILPFRLDLVDGNFKAYEAKLLASFDNGNSFHILNSGVTFKNEYLNYENLIIWNPEKSSNLTRYYQSPALVFKLLIIKKQAQCYGISKTNEAIEQNTAKDSSKYAGILSYKNLVPIFTKDINFPYLEQTTHMNKSDNSYLEYMYTVYEGKKWPLKEYTPLLSVSFDNGESFQLIQKGLELPQFIQEKGNQIGWYPEKNPALYPHYRYGEFIYNIALTSESVEKLAETKFYKTEYLNKLYELFKSGNSITGASQISHIQQNVEESFSFPCIIKTKRFAFLIEEPYKCEGWNFRPTELVMPIKMLKIHNDESTSPDSYYQGVLDFQVSGLYYPRENGGGVNITYKQQRVSWENRNTPNAIPFEPRNTLPAEDVDNPEAEAWQSADSGKVIFSQRENVDTFNTVNRISIIEYSTPHEISCNSAAINPEVRPLEDRACDQYLDHGEVDMKVRNMAYNDISKTVYVYIVTTTVGIGRTTLLNEPQEFTMDAVLIDENGYYDVESIVSHTNIVPNGGDFNDERTDGLIQFSIPEGYDIFSVGGMHFTFAGYSQYVPGRKLNQDFQH